MNLSVEELHMKLIEKGCAKETVEAINDQKVLLSMLFNQIATQPTPPPVAPVIAITTNNNDDFLSMLFNDPSNDPTYKPVSETPFVDQLLSKDEKRKQEALDKNLLYIQQMEEKSKNNPSECKNNEKGGARATDKAGNKRKRDGVNNIVKKKKKINCAVYISNLPRTVDEIDVKRFFSRAGPIVQTKIYSLKEGKTTKDATVNYKDLSQALNAIRMLNGCVFAPGYVIKVERANYGGTANEEAEEEEEEEEKSNEVIIKEASIIQNKPMIYNKEEEKVDDLLDDFFSSIS